VSTLEGGFGVEGIEMMIPGNQCEGRLTNAAAMEHGLAAVLMETAGDVARSECFDVEERAEIYAILDTLRSDTRVHQQVVGRWVNDRTGEAGDV